MLFCIIDARNQECGRQNNSTDCSHYWCELAYSNLCCMPQGCFCFFILSKVASSCGPEGTSGCPPRRSQGWMRCVLALLVADIHWCWSSGGLWAWILSGCTQHSRVLSNWRSSGFRLFFFFFGHCCEEKMLLYYLHATVFMQSVNFDCFVIVWNFMATTAV